jgi:hypothetical protein
MGEQALEQSGELDNHRRAVCIVIAAGDPSVLSQTFWMKNLEIGWNAKQVEHNETRTLCDSWNLMKGEEVMATTQTNYSQKLFKVVHPLDDQPEEKCRAEGIGPLLMTRGVRISLMVLRAYLTAMTLMLIYHVLDLSGILGK